MNRCFNNSGKNQTIVFNLNTYSSKENHARKEKDSAQRNQKINTNALVLTVQLLLVAIIFTLFLACSWINPTAVKVLIDVLKAITLCFF